MSHKAPRHIAIIMDGNGRWAQRRGHSRIFGHVRGSGRVKDIVKRAGEMGVKALTLYAFSTENWSRPAHELSILWKILKKYIVKEIDELDAQNVRFNVIGEIDRLPADVRPVIQAAIARLSKNSGLMLTFALSYGSRRELARAMQLISCDIGSGKLQPSEVCETTIEKYLWTSVLGELSDVDLVIRTSGEQRISNFLLWQAAYAELYFTEKCWPDFAAADFSQAITAYETRDRRFGNVATKTHILGPEPVHV